MSVIFVASDKAAEVLQPTDCTLDFPASFDPPEFSAILYRGLRPIYPVPANQFDFSLGQSGSQWIAVRGLVVQQSLRDASDDARIQERLDQRHLIRTRAGDRRGHGNPMSFAVDHDLGSLAAFGLADLFAPFFAEENVPSAVVSLKSSFPWLSSVRSNRAHAFCQTPLSVQSRCRRQQVVKDGKHLGKSFHRAPVRRIQRMPSTHRRGSSGGRPPLGDGSGFANKSSTKRHCSSVSCDSVSVPGSRRGVSASCARDRFRIVCCLLSTAPNCKTTAKSLKSQI